MWEELSLKKFNKRKADILVSIYEPAVASALLLIEGTSSEGGAKYDKSLKTSVDDKLGEVCYLLNGMSEYYTTSCCSGRIQIYRSAIKKEDLGLPIKQWKHVGCIAYASHAVEELISAEEMMNRLSESTQHYDKSDTKPRNTFLPSSLTSTSHCVSSRLIFEPLLLHVKCRTLESALKLLEVCRHSGLKEIGITGYKKGTGFHVSISGSDRIAIPCETYTGGIICTLDQMREWINECKSYMKRNDDRIRLFQANLSKLQCTE